MMALKGGQRKKQNKTKVKQNIKQECKFGLHQCQKHPKLCNLQNFLIASTFQIFDHVSFPLYDLQFYKKKINLLSFPGLGRGMYILLECKWGPSTGYGWELSIWFM